MLSANYRATLRVLGKPRHEGSAILQCLEIPPPIKRILILDTQAQIKDGIEVQPATYHEEFCMEDGFMPQDELTEAQRAEGWTMLFSLETLAQYKADHAEAIAAELPPVPELLED